VKLRKNWILVLLVVVCALIFAAAFTALIFGDELDAMYNVIGIRVATLLVAFASFCSTSLFSYLIYSHNKTVSRINDDTNRRAEMFRELQFASSNYSIIEFMDRMLIYAESSRYVENFIYKNNSEFHMIEEKLSEEDIMKHPENYSYISLKIPFRVAEGKVVSGINLNELNFERLGNNFKFVTPSSRKETKAYILYNEHTKRNNVITNLVVPKDSDFFIPEQINAFSKIKIRMKVTSLLGVEVSGISELYFTNPEQIEGNGSNTYKINSSNFSLTEMPRIGENYYHNQI
jgi:hypothetical protein